MRYRLKLYADVMSKEGIKTLEIEADDTECEELGEYVSLTFLKKEADKSVRVIYGVDFSKVIEFYAIDNVKFISEQTKTGKVTSSVLALVSNISKEIK